MKKFLFTFISLLLFILLIPTIYAQNINIGTALGDESVFYAQTKQLNQFFRRFNAEEDLEGNRLYDKDANYRDVEMRKKYIQLLFDAENKGISTEQKNNFNREVTTTKPTFLEFHGGRWFSEVNTKFYFNGEEMDLVLFLQIEEEGLGSKWVISNVFFEPFYELFYNTDTTQSDGIKFLHPMSHELDFMNLIRVFQDKNRVEQFIAKEHHPDFLSLFLYEIKKGNLKFETVTNVKYHVFQVDNWYFELSDFNRPGYNTGWLISNLVNIPEDQKDILIKYIYREEE